MTEFVDHLHEHFIDPCVVEDGAYVLPSQPGYSAEMYDRIGRRVRLPGRRPTGRRVSRRTTVVDVRGSVR